MMPDGIKEKFELYRKWFNTFLIKEFMNLPLKYQSRFLALLQNFTENCNKIHNENKKIKEKQIFVYVKKVLPPDNKKESYIVCGNVDDGENEIKMTLPGNIQKPKIGEKLLHTVYSLNEKIWYSSKEELITKN